VAHGEVSVRKIQLVICLVEQVVHRNKQSLRVT
jgi:hypothetical protein